MPQPLPIPQPMLNAIEDDNLPPKYEQIYKNQSIIRIENEQEPTTPLPALPYTHINTQAELTNNQQNHRPISSESSSNRKKKYIL